MITFYPPGGTAGEETVACWFRAGRDLLSGSDALEAKLAGLGSSSVFLIVDPAVRDAVDRAVNQARLLTVCGTAEVGGSPGLDEVRHLAERLVTRSPSVVVAVGGGATLDAAKLAVVTAEHPQIVGLLAARAAAAGFCRLPAGLRVARRLIAVPTTVGTGSEANPIACVDVIAGERTLVYGECLRPAEATLDVSLSASLSETALREGGVEAVLRLLGPAVGTPSEHPAAELDVASLLGRLDTVLARPELGATDRAELAYLSYSTHASAALIGRGTFPAPLWYAANELSMVLGIRKVPASLVLIGPWFDRVESEAGRWGDAQRLSDLLALIEGGPPQLNETARDRIAQVLERWRVPVPGAPAFDPLWVSERIWRRWGDSLPMLGGLTRSDVHSWLRSSRASEQLA